MLHLHRRWPLALSVFSLLLSTAMSADAPAGGAGVASSTQSCGWNNLCPEKSVSLSPTSSVHISLDPIPELPLTSFLEIQPCCSEVGHFH